MSRTPDANRTRRIDELEGLRGILALWVAVSHFFCWCSFSQFPLVGPRLLKNTMAWLWVQFSFAANAVDTFIILSGFAISYMLHNRPQTYRQFMTGRFFRIYPVYLVCLLAGFLTVPLAQFALNHIRWHDNEYFVLYVQPNLNRALIHPIAHLIAHLTLLFGLIPEQILPGASGTLLPPAWSITLEWQYYLLAPFLAVLVCRPAGIFLLGLIGCGNYVYSHFWGNAFLPEEISLFLIGIGSFHLYANAQKFRKFPFRIYALATAVAIVLITGWHWLALLIWLLVFSCALAEDDRPSERWLLHVRKFLLWSPLQFTGKISYPLYLVHWPIIVCLMAGLIFWRPEIKPFPALVLMLCAGLPLILLAAWLLHRLIEKPLMRLGKKISR